MTTILKSPLNIPFPWFVFDVESLGLFGYPFAVGWCVVDKDGKELDSSWLGCSIESVRDKSNPLSDIESYNWCKENIPEEVLKGNVAQRDMYKYFKRNLSYWQAKGCSVICDCPFPVEAKFLRRLIKRFNDIDGDILTSPYPLYDVASILAAHGKDPLKEYPRLGNEIKHHPLWDSVVSAKQLYSLNTELAWKDYH